MSFERIQIAPRAARGWSSLDRDQREQAHAILSSLDENPIAGAPLLGALRGYWSMRRGPVRVVYRIAPQARAVGVVLIAPAPEGFP